MTNKYNNGKIYKITSEHTIDVYVGSTTRVLNDRLKDHVRKYNLHLKDNKHDYITSYEILKYPTYEIVLIESVNVDTKKELLDREGHFIKTTPNCVNKLVMGRTELEWREANKEHKKEQNKKYNQDNKEELSKYHKKYRTENADEIKVRQKTYHDKNKEKENLQKKQVIDCECGLSYTAGHKTRHLQTERHKKYMVNGDELKAKQANSKYCECGSPYTKAHKAAHLKTLKHQTYIKNKLEQPIIIPIDI